MKILKIRDMIKLVESFRDQYHGKRIANKLIISIIQLLRDEIESRKEDEKNIITFFLCIIVLTGCSSSKKVENIEREQIIGTLYNVSESAVSYPDIPSLTKNSEIIIYGEVVQIESVTPENGIARAWRSNNLFLVESPHKGFGELYTRVTGPEAEYFELEDGQFVKMESWAGYQNSLSIEEKAADENPPLYETYTFDQISIMINESIDLI